VFAIADVAFGPSAGTYYGTAKCPATVTGPAVAKFGETPWGDTADNDSGSSSVDTNDAAANAQSALRNALTAEKTIYTDEQMYTADLKQLRDVESSLAWGTKVHVYVADAVDTGDKGVVCIWETDSSVGKLYSIADVAAGPDAGTYFGTTACPAKITPSAFKTAEFSASW
jgi:hypothetical protein